MKRDNLIIIFLMLLIVGVSVFSIIQDISRQAMYAPICTKSGWVYIEGGPFNHPRCLDIESGLLHVPKELYYAYKGETMPISKPQKGHN